MPIIIRYDNSKNSSHSDGTIMYSKSKKRIYLLDTFKSGTAVWIVTSKINNGMIKYKGVLNKQPELLQEADELNRFIDPTEYIGKQVWKFSITLTESLNENIKQDNIPLWNRIKYTIDPRFISDAIV
jgi:hypothetical protein